MVSVAQLRPQNRAAALEPLAAGLGADERALIGRALEYAEPLYAGQSLSTGEPEWPHALGLTANLAAISMDAAARAAGSTPIAVSAAVTAGAGPLFQIDLSQASPG